MYNLLKAISRVGLAIAATSVSAIPNVDFEILSSEMAFDSCFCNRLFHHPGNKVAVKILRHVL